MKTLLLLSLTLASTAALASRAPLLSYHSHTGGFTPPAERKYVECLVFSDKVVKSVNLGGAESSITLPVAFTSSVKDAEAIIRLSNSAKKGKIKRGPTPMDAPMETFSIVELQPDDTTKEVVLRYGITGMRNAVILNTSKAADKLIKFLNVNCSDQ